MSESYVINEKRELILDRVKEFIYQNGGVVKKSQLNELGIDYRRILDFVEKGDLIRTLTLGVTEIDYGGAKMKIFDRERLMCECLKYEDKMERELFKEGLLAYIRDPKKDVAKLMKYARERRVVKKVQTMIGVWL